MKTSQSERASDMRLKLAITACVYLDKYFRNSGEGKMLSLEASHREADQYGDEMSERLYRHSGRCSSPTSATMSSH